MTAQVHSDKMNSDTGVCMMRRYATAFFYVGEMVPTDIHGYLLNIYGDQTVDVSTVRQWVVQWQQQQWVSFTVADFYKHGMQALVHC